MERYDRLYRLYDEFDVDALRAYQDYVDLFPPVDSRIALEYWREAREELDDRKAAIERAFPGTGETFAELAATATRDQAFAALDLAATHGRAVNVLVLDVDETLRSAGSTDNEIPRETLHRLGTFHEAGVPIVVCTGQTLENVKGFLIQGLGSEIVHSGDVSVVYEGGTGVFTPGHGAATKQLLYDRLDDDVRAVFDRVRSRVLPDAPGRLREGCHLQGNEFNVTLKPNFDVGSPEARDVIDRALSYQLDLLGGAAAAVVGDPVEDAGDWARVHYAERDPEIRTVLERDDALPARDPGAVPDALRALFEGIGVAYYEADAAEITSRELNKAAGVRAALDVLGIDDPFALVMGDSKSDLRVMEWVAEESRGIAAAPRHASVDVLEHVEATDDLVYPPGGAADVLRTCAALNRLVELDG